MAVKPWTAYSAEESPFVGMFALAGLVGAAGVVNFIVLTSATSSANSGIYSTSRMVYGLAQDGDAPPEGKNVTYHTQRRPVPNHGFGTGRLSYHDETQFKECLRVARRASLSDGQDSRRQAASDGGTPIHREGILDGRLSRRTTANGAVYPRAAHGLHKDRIASPDIPGWGGGDAADRTGCEWRRGKRRDPDRLQAI